MEKCCKKITYGMAGKWFYCLSEQENQDEQTYYCLYQIDDSPSSMCAEDIQKFMDEHFNEGESYAGDWKEVMEYLKNIFQSQTNMCITTESRRKLSIEELQGQGFQYLHELQNTDFGVYEYHNGECYTLEAYNYRKKEHDSIIAKAPDLTAISSIFVKLCEEITEK